MITVDSGALVFYVAAFLVLLVAVAVLSWLLGTTHCEHTHTSRVLYRRGYRDGHRDGRYEASVFVLDHEQETRRPIPTLTLNRVIRGEVATKLLHENLAEN